MPAPAFDPDEDIAFAIMGRFFAEYARAEAYVHYLTRRRSGLHDDTARITFAGRRLSNLTECLRGFMRLKETEVGEYDDIGSCLVRLGIIGEVRHILAHRYVTVYTTTN